jgi:hypothetical protein
MNSNPNPRPYVWTKPAEQILESIARYANGSTKHDTREPVRDCCTERYSARAIIRPRGVHGRRGSY